MLLQSQEGLLEADVSAADNPLASEQAKKALEVLSTLPGRKSDGFARLRERLNATALNTANP